MAEGNILVRLFRIKDLLPMTKGSIRITNSKTGNIVYEKENAFDISGRSEIISVVTIDRELSQEPYEESGNPYLLYNIELSRKDIKMLLLKA